MPIQGTIKHTSAPLPTPDTGDLRRIFDHIAHAEYEGVKGVLRFSAQGEAHGPVVGISLCTHGNEPAGLAALWYFTEIKPLLKALKKGSVFFVLNNLQAATSYWNASTEAHRRTTRYVDYNMNRLPVNVMRRTDGLRYETRRVQALKPIWKRFEVAMDIHSTSQAAAPMILSDHDLDTALIKGFPVEKLITNIAHVMRDKPVTSFYGKKGHIRNVMLECGQHEAPEAFRTSIQCVKALLLNLGMIENGLEDGLREGSAFEHYHVEDALFLPDESYELVKVFPNFESVKRGDVIARGKNGELQAPMDGHSLMCPDTTKPLFIAEEIMFFSRPVEKLTMKTS